MKLLEQVAPGGTGVMATADAGGAVNAAVYAMPRRVDGDALAWGMTEGRTRRNLRENPNAAYLYVAPGPGYRGVRLTLRLLGVDESGSLLEEIRARTREVSGPGAAEAVRYVARFTVVEERPLV